MSIEWQPTVVMGLFGSAGLCAVIRWFHPATVSLTVFSIVFAASWLMLGVVLFRAKQPV